MSKPFLALRALLALNLALGLAACGRSELTPVDEQARSSAGSSEDTSGSNWAQGLNITARFLSTYAGTFSDKSSKLQSLTFNPDGSYELVWGGQVGSKGSVELPYPTICWLRSSGILKRVIERSMESRKSYLPYASHVLLLWETSVAVLEPNETGTERVSRCDRLVHPDWKRAASRPLFVELLTDDSLRLHRSGSAQSAGTEPRSNATLDEVFTRDSNKPLAND